MIKKRRVVLIVTELGTGESLTFESKKLKKYFKAYFYLILPFLFKNHLQVTAIT